MVDRLDEERIEILKKWGADLATDTREQLRAAGKAITILIHEIERLQDNTQRARGAPLNDASKVEVGQEPFEAESSQSLGTSLRERLGAVIPSGATFDRDE